MFIIFWCTCGVAAWTEDRQRPPQALYLQRARGFNNERSSVCLRQWESGEYLTVFLLRAGPDTGLRLEPAESRLLTVQPPGMLWGHRSRTFFPCQACREPSSPGEGRPRSDGLSSGVWCSASGQEQSNYPVKSNPQDKSCFTSAAAWANADRLKSTKTEKQLVWVIVSRWPGPSLDLTQGPNTKEALDWDTNQDGCFMVIWQ